jgi:hypoxanthine phosphoribosyltransferase
LTTGLTHSVFPELLNAGDSLVVHFTESQIQERVKALADEINTRYKGCDQITLVVVMKGAFMFAADLIKHLSVPCQMEFIRLASYGHDTVSSGKVQAVDLSLPDLSGKHVLIVEDIIDTGLTLHFFKEYLMSIHHPESLSLAVMLDKKDARKEEVTVDFVGFTVGEQFLVGYGLDYQGYCRNLPYIAALVKS